MPDVPLQGCRRYTLKPSVSPSGAPYATYQGKFVKLHNVPRHINSPTRALRGKCLPFTDGARRRCMQTAARINPDAVPIFVHLTYGGEWSRDPRVWKEHLDRFLKCLVRLNPKLCGLWKLEPQRRGAPHYHLLVYGGRIPKDWIAATWARCSDDESLKHLQAGTRVESIRTSNGAMFYCSKYICKRGAENDLEPEWQHAGRWWGVFNRGSMPWAAATAAPLGPEALHVLQAAMLSVLVKRNKGQPLPEYVQPVGVFIERGDLRQSFAYHAGLYADTVGAVGGGREAVIARIMGELSPLIPAGS